MKNAWPESWASFFALPASAGRVRRWCFSCRLNGSADATGDQRWSSCARSAWCFEHHAVVRNTGKPS